MLQRQYIPPEKRCRTLHIACVDDHVLEVLAQIEGFALEGGFQPVSAATPRGNGLTKATYLFRTSSEASQFAGHVGEWGISYSILPAEEYQRLSTEQMHPAMGAIFSAFAATGDEDEE